MNEIKPWSVLIVLGGIVIAVSTFIGWNEIVAFDGTVLTTENAWDKGLLGLYQLIIGVVVTVYGLAQISGRNLGGKMAGLTTNQWMIALPVAVAIWGFAFQFDDNPAFGVLTTWVSGVVAAAGAAMSERTSEILAADRVGV